MTRPAIISDTRGLTLLELVAAMAIFALVAVMGLQALSGSMRAQERLQGVDARTATLARALMHLRQDLGAAAPFDFVPPGEDTSLWPFVDQSGDDGRLSFSMAGQPVLPGVQAGGQGRVIWRFDAARGQLTRQVWPVLYPASDDAAGPEVVMLDGITDMQVQAHGGPDLGWLAGFGTRDDVSYERLPQAVEVHLRSDTWGPLRVVVSY